MFTKRHHVQFYETDLMGIVHHSNYLRFCEEARVAWAHHHGLIEYQKPETAAHFAVLETWIKHLAPLKFGDELEVDIQARAVGRVRVQFQYQLRNATRVVAKGSTTHAALDRDLKPMRLPKEMHDILEKESWTETWLSNS